ncbi:MAG TPA: hypothetical protein VIN36_06625 [Thiobacillus sp.]
MTTPIRNFRGGRLRSFGLAVGIQGDSFHAPPHLVIPSGLVIVLDGVSGLAHGALQGQGLLMAI